MAHKNERVVIDGKDVSEAFGLMLIDGTELSPPAPKTYTVDIPGGNGVIDLTEALTGDTAFERRSQSFTFGVVGPEDWERTKTRVSNFLHGRYLEYSLSWDPGYVYRGRFSVKEYTQHGLTGTRYGQLSIEVDADPYKSKGTQAFRLNATGGRLFRFESGRRKVRPTVECESVCWVTFGGETVAVPAGTHVLRDVVFREGVNEVYVNSRRIWAETWADVGEGGADEAAWAAAAALTWDGIQRLGLADAEGVPQSWAEVALDTWAGLGAKTWRDLDYRRTEAAQGSADVYLTYDWEDL